VVPGTMFRDFGMAIGAKRKIPVRMLTILRPGLPFGLKDGSFRRTIHTFAKVPGLKRQVDALG